MFFAIYMYRAFVFYIQCQSSPCGRGWGSCEEIGHWASPPTLSPPPCLLNRQAGSYYFTNTCRLPFLDNSKSSLCLFCASSNIQITLNRCYSLCQMIRLRSLHCNFSFPFSLSRSCQSRSLAGPGLCNKNLVNPPIIKSTRQDVSSMYCRIEIFHDIDGVQEGTCFARDRGLTRVN